MKSSIRRFAAAGGVLLCSSLACVAPEALDESPSSSESAAVVGTYQAESYTLQNGCTKATTHSGYSGTGYVDFGGNGSLVEWNNVKVPSAGQYTLVFKYANGGAGARRCAITLNGTTNGGNVTFGVTGGWAKWSTNSIKVSLRQGTNKIRITANTSTGGPNLDKMDVTSDGNPVQADLKFPVRGAFYYPWFPETWTVQGHHVSYHPTTGYYDSGNANTIDKHIAAMRYGKIDLAIASWWGPGKHDEAKRIKSLLERTKALGSPLKWAFYYESEGFGNPSATKIRGDLDYLMANYGGSASMARVNGKPVIFVYNANDSSCEVAKRWAQANNGKWYVVLKVFGGFTNCQPQPDSWHQYGPSTAAQRHAGYSYVISPGFWRADLKSPNLARDLGRFQKNVRDMVASRERWQLITSFNEWGEGTAVEAATEWASSSGYGKYLDALHNNGVASSN